MKPSRQWALVLIIAFACWAVPVAQADNLKITLQNAQTGNANGTQQTVSGNATATLAIETAGGFAGTVNFEAKNNDATTYNAVMCSNQATGVVATTATAAATWICPLNAAGQFRARTSGVTAGNVTVYAEFSPGTPNVVLGLVSTQTRAQDSPCKTVTVNAQGSGNAGITVDATAGGVSVLAASTTRCGAVLTNLQGGGDALCGPTTITVTTTVGYRLAAGQSLTLGLEGQQAWKCIRQGATNATLYVVESTT